jgi:hypothetical protein
MSEQQMTDEEIEAAARELSIVSGVDMLTRWERIYGARLIESLKAAREQIRTKTGEWDRLHDKIISLRGRAPFVIVRSGSYAAATPTAMGE